LSPGRNFLKKGMARPRFIALILALGTLAVYLPARHYGFSLYDDSDYVTENPVIKNGLTWAGVKWALTTWHASNWHPLTWLSHMLDCQLFGLNAAMAHAVNVLLHTVNAVLLFALLRRLTGALWPSAFVAALFAWHPLHVESVAWITERKDVLSTLFELLTLQAYARFAEGFKDHPPSLGSVATGSSKSKVFYSSALLMFAFGLMSKPMLVTLPFVLLLLDYWPLQRFNALTLRGLLLEKIPFFVLSAASCAVTFLAQRHSGAVISLKNVPLICRLENAPVAVIQYLLKMVWPENLAVFYPMTKFPPPVVGVALAALFFISTATWFLRKRQPYLPVGWLWFLGTLVPVIGLVQVGGAAMADRYTYFPSIGIFLAAALGVRDLAERFQFPKTAAAAGGAVLAACLFLMHRQLNFWRDDIALFSHTLAVTKNNDIAHLNLGFALEKIGRNHEAMDEFQAALNINPDLVQARNNLANLLDDAGHPSAALTEFQAALRIDPNYPAAHENLGTLFVELGRFDDAMKQYAEAAKLEPMDWHVPYLAGKALLKGGRDTDAVPFFQQALRDDPNNPQTLVFFAQVLASDENPQVRDGPTALRLAQKADDLTGGVQPAMFDTLAMAEAELGRFDDAQKAEENALALAKDFNLTNDISLIAQRLELYKTGKPFRQTFTNAPVKME